MPSAFSCTPPFSPWLYENTPSASFSTSVSFASTATVTAVSSAVVAASSTATGGVLASTYVTVLSVLVEASEALPAASFAAPAPIEATTVPVALIPLTECLKDTVARVVPYWNERIAPRVAAGERVLVAAHGNSLRALIKHFDGMSDEAIVAENVPTAIPLVYELDDALRPRGRRYLGDPAAVAAAMHSVAAQGKAK